MSAFNVQNGTISCQFGDYREAQKLHHKQVDSGSRSTSREREVKKSNYLVEFSKDHSTDKKQWFGDYDRHKGNINHSQWLYSMRCEM